ncbi:TPA: hypothetical protein ACWMA9_005696 [Klebsiella pneumoniae]|nr:hypothetical protein [Klebsiella pneumoniae]
MAGIDPPTPSWLFAPREAIAYSVEMADAHSDPGPLIPTIFQPVGLFEFVFATG